MAGMGFSSGVSGVGTPGDDALTVKGGKTPLTADQNLADVASAVTALANLNGAPLASPTFTGAPIAPTPSALDNSTKIGTTAYSDAAVLVEKNRALAQEALLAPKASPTFTGTTTAPEFTASGLTGAVAASRYVGATTGGAPVSGTFAVGDFVIDQAGGVWVCTTAGTPGTWTLISGPAELGQVQISSSLSSLASTTDAAVTGLTKTVTVPATGRPIYCDFTAYVTSGTNAAAIFFTLYEDGVSVEGLTGFTTLSATSGTGYQCGGSVRRTPAAGSHTYSVDYKISTGTFSIRADLIPCRLRIWQA